MTVKLCMDCFRKHFGEKAKVKIVTWSRVCSDCGKETPRMTVLIKAEINATMAGKQTSRAPREAA